MKFKDGNLFEVAVTENSHNEGKNARCTDINYNDHKQVIDLMSKHLAKIFVATHKKKIKKELDKLKANCK